MSSGCAGGYALLKREGHGTEPPAWYSPAKQADRTALDRWSSAVGPPVIVRRNSTRAIARPRTLIVVSWNIDVGRGNVAALMAELRGQAPDVPIVFLLQEAFRKGPDVPATAPVSARFAGHLGDDGSSPDRDTIESTADRCGLDLYYVPSMRNGEPSRSDEDRGNAILSSLVLTDYDAIELPFERQRRVAVAATISGGSSRADQWQLRLVSARFLAAQFKYAFLLIFIAAAVITPTGDMMTQAIFAAPMIALYLLSIVIAWVVGPKRDADEIEN